MQLPDPERVVESKFAKTCPERTERSKNKNGPERVEGSPFSRFGLEHADGSWLFDTRADAHVMPQNVRTQLGELELQQNLKDVEKSEWIRLGSTVVIGFLTRDNAF